MSRIVATLVYSKRVGTMSRKAVLAYFADRANDDGTDIWASKQRIADEIECSRKNVIATVNSLVADGLLVEAGKKPCRNGFTVQYNMNLAAIQALPDSASIADTSPQVTSEDCDTSPQVTPRRNPRLHKPSFNRPPSEAKASSGKRAKVWVQKPDGISDAVWRGWLVHRKTAFTDIALEGFEREAAAAGWTVEAAIREAIERGWQGFKAKWVKDKQNGTANRASYQSGKPQDGFLSVCRDVANRHADGTAEPDGRTMRDVTGTGVTITQ